MPGKDRYPNRDGEYDRYPMDRPYYDHFGQDGLAPGRPDDRDRDQDRDRDRFPPRNEHYPPRRYPMGDIPDEFGKLENFHSIPI